MKLHEKYGKGFGVDLETYLWDVRARLIQRAENLSSRDDFFTNAELDDDEDYWAWQAPQAPLETPLQAGGPPPGLSVQTATVQTATVNTAPVKESPDEAFRMARLALIAKWQRKGKPENNNGQPDSK